MSIYLTLQCHKQQDVIERILRVVRHRGFTLDSMSLASSCEQFELNLTLSSKRPVHLLVSQVEKLQDVITLTYVNEAENCSAADA